MTSETFKTFRKRLGLTQAQAAAAIGIGRDMWGKLERGEARCERPVMYGLAMAAVLYGLPPFGDSASFLQRPERPVEAR